MKQKDSKSKTLDAKEILDTSIKIAFLVLIVFAIYAVRKGDLVGFILAFAILFGVAIGFILRVSSAMLTIVKKKTEPKSLLYSAEAERR